VDRNSRKRLERLEALITKSVTGEPSHLLTLSDTVPPERWKRICEKAAALAEEGDAKAREWLARYLVGDKCLSDEEPQGRDLVIHFIRPRKEGEDRTP
jgi:hypothetical protein